MAEQTTGRTESLPPQYYQDLMRGVPGANVPGILPMLNPGLSQSSYRGIGVAGGNAVFVSRSKDS
jgi:hypothetical protein